MPGTDKEINDAGKWFWGGLAVSIVFSLFLVCVDYSLTNSDTEEQKAARIRELRTAQASLGSGDIDSRQLSPFTE